MGNVLLIPYHAAVVLGLLLLVMARLSSGTSLVPSLLTPCLLLIPIHPLVAAADDVGALPRYVLLALMKLVADSSVLHT